MLRIPSNSREAIFLISALFYSTALLYGSTRDIKDDQAQLVDLEKRWLAAEDRPDVLESILADDFVHVLPAGFVTKAQQLDYMRKHPASERVARSFETLRVRIFGNTGVVTGIVLAKTPDGTARKTIFTDVFAFRNGRWQAVNAQETPFQSSN